MKKTHKSAKPVSAEQIARMADKGKDISKFFKKAGHIANRSNHQPSTKTLVRQALDQHYSAQWAKQSE